MALRNGISFSRHYTDGKKHPYDDVKWVRRTSKITDSKGDVIFQADDLEFPDFWSDLSVNIAANKYFRKAGVPGVGRETSLKQLISRIAGSLTTAAMRQGMFASEEDVQIYSDELTYILLHQIASFNSPVLFNVGLFDAYGIKGHQENWAWDFGQGEVLPSPDDYMRPQGSACFILDVKDSLTSIQSTLAAETQLFRNGSGVGWNCSNIREKGASLSAGGTSSGVMSFLSVFDKNAGSIKSGGVTRRAAKLVCMDMDHPDIVDFIQWKVREEKKAQALIAAGYPADYNGEAYGTVDGQNSNNSVQVSDAFMEAVRDDADWVTRSRVGGHPVKKYKARYLWRQIAEAAWACADPGVQFSDTFNAWNTHPASGRINSTNPCCFTGDMLVDTSEGLIPFAKLQQMCSEGVPLPYAYAFDQRSGLPVLRPITKVWVAGNTDTLVEVVTDKGLVLRCTPEHRFLLQNGEYKEAKDLAPGTRLRKIPRAINPNRSSRRVLNHRATPTNANGSTWQNRFVWEQIHGPIPSGYEVHHRNEDPTDDRLSNLELRAKTDHRREHSAGEANPRYIDADARALVEAWDRIESSVAAKCARRADAYRRILELRSTGMPYAKIAARLDSEGVLPDRAGSWSASSVHSLKENGPQERGEVVTVSRWNAYIVEAGLEGALPLANARGIRGLSWEEFAAWIASHRDDVNDRVTSVRFVNLATKETVYDLEVEGVHNFGVTCPGASVVHTIVVSNSEFACADNTSCNLCCLNLGRFLVDSDGPGSKLVFASKSFVHAARIVFFAQEAMVDYCSYPTRDVADNSHRLRPLGLGYSNLGSVLMKLGLAYDSDDARSFAAAVTSLMSAAAYHLSAQMAESFGPWPEYMLAANAEAQNAIVQRHYRLTEKNTSRALEGDELRREGDLWLEALTQWEHAINLGVLKGAGFRNCYVSLLMPAGTVGLLMGCDTTGIEPDFALVKHKLLAGGGTMRIANESVSVALRQLGYSEAQCVSILGHVESTGTMEGCTTLKPEHHPVFDCASATGPSGRYIAPMGHVRMCAAVQPFLSMAISKTTNLPNSATVEDVQRIYEEAYRLGVKSIALYRDGCKASQPLTAGMKQEATVAPSAVPEGPGWGHRISLPPRRGGFTQEALIGGHKLYLRTGEYPDGRLGEIFIDMHKEGASFRSVLNGLAIAVSMGLQRGVPLEDYVEQFTFTRYEPQGQVEGDDNVKLATSVVDYVFRVLGIAYLGRTDLGHVQKDSPTEDAPPAPRSRRTREVEHAQQATPGSDTPPCIQCGGETQRAGACAVCKICGHSQGCG